MLREPILAFICIAAMMVCTAGLVCVDGSFWKIFLAVSLSGISYTLGSITHCEHPGGW